MKKSLKISLIGCLLSGLALVLSGCYSSGKNGTMGEKMDDSMSGNMEMLEKEKMHDPMSDSMDMMESEKKDTMKKEAMQETMN